jgi:glycine cleavage system regulatory protein
MQTSLGGGEVFRASAQVAVAADIDMNVLKNDLEELANDLMVDMRLEQ